MTKFEKLEVLELSDGATLATIKVHSPTLQDLILYAAFHNVNTADIKIEPFAENLEPDACIELSWKDSS